MTSDPTRKQILTLLDGRGAHMTFEEAVADFPDEAINAFPPNVTYTPWHLVEHLRLTQLDMLEYVTTAEHPRRDWPADYWPASEARATAEDWAASVQAFHADLAQLRALVADPERDLDARIPWTPGHSLLRCVRIIADHNAYHVGELAILRQVMGAWPPGLR